VTEEGVLRSHSIKSKDESQLKGLTGNKDNTYITKQSKIESTISSGQDFRNPSGRSEEEILPDGFPLSSRLSITDQDWTDWNDRTAAANIFHHPAWTELLSICYGYQPFAFALRNPHGSITAGIPLMELKSISGKRRWVALPFTDHCSPLFNDRESFDELLRSLLAIYQQSDLAELEIRWPTSLIPGIQQSTQFVLHRLPLEANPDKLYSQFHTGHRRNIKIAQNSGVRIEQGVSEQHMRDFYRLHLLTRQRQGMPTQPSRFFRLLREILLEQDLGFILLAYREDACIAASIFLKWQKTLTYKYGASTADALQYRPNNLVMWAAIRWGCENGYTIFDMGRTDLDNTGLRRYKSGWGAEEGPLTYSILAKEPLRSGSGHLMLWMNRIIRGSPVWVSRISGEMFYKYFG